jgi:hypothetical protein
MSQPQIVKYTPKNLYSNYSLLTISDIISEEPHINQEITIENNPSTFSITQAPFKVSQRKVLRTSKR